MVIIKFTHSQDQEHLQLVKFQTLLQTIQFLIWLWLVEVAEVADLQETEVAEVVPVVLENIDHQFQVVMLYHL